VLHRRRAGLGGPSLQQLDDLRLDGADVLFELQDHV
jgi:hypothetical protein